MAACLLALAIFCVPVEEGTISFIENPLVAVADFERSAVEHSIYFRDDNPAAGDDLDQERCIASQCVSYSVRTDGAPANRARITLRIRRQGDIPFYKITLIGDRDEQLETALEAIRIIDDQGAAGMTLQDLIG